MAKRRMVRVGLIKAVPEDWKLKKNWDTFVELGERAVERGAQFLCTPECFLDGYTLYEEEGWQERFPRVAQSLTSKTNYVARAREFARKHGVHLVFGFTQKAKEGLYNAAALIDDSGEILGVYHKTHLQYQDAERFLPGMGFPVWDTKHGKIGIMICADRRWPETARTMKVRGAEIIMTPTYGMRHLDNEWWMRTRSYENELYVCFTHPTVSFIAGPRGEIQAKLESNLPDVLVHDLDLSEPVEDMFPDRRPDIYEY